VGLGWFSVGLGLAEVAAPRRMARVIGLPPTSSTTRMLQTFGARKIGNGLAILAQPDNATWLWSRVAGDALDLASLATAARSSSSDTTRATFATVSVLGVAALDLICARQLQSERRRHRPSRAFAESRSGATASDQATYQAITINASLDLVRNFWEQGRQQLPSTLRDLAYDAEADAGRAADVTFRAASGARGTEVRVRVPSRASRRWRDKVASVAGRDIASLMHDDLRKVKQIIETGEVVISEGPSLRRAAQPPVDPRELQQLAGVSR
jgi:hypothetical protein